MSLGISVLRLNAPTNEIKPSLVAHSRYFFASERSPFAIDNSRRAIQKPDQARLPIKLPDRIPNPRDHIVSTGGRAAVSERRPRVMSCTISSRTARVVLVSRRRKIWLPSTA